MTDIQERTISANGLEFAYLEVGDGPLLLLLHGFPDDAWGWAGQLSALADGGFRAVAPFLRGFAPTEIPADGRYDPSTLGQDLVALIDELGDGPAHVVGHDFGANMTYAALARSPESIDRAVTLAVPHPATFPLVALTPHLAHHSFHLWFNAIPGLAPAVYLATDFAPVQYIWELWSDPETDVSEDVARVKRTLSAPGVLEAVTNGYYQALMGTPENPGVGPEMMAPVTVPTMVIYGREDPLPAVLAAEEAEHFHGGYRRVDIPGARHFVQRDQPQRVNELLIQWLTADRDSLARETPATGA